MKNRVLSTTLFFSGCCIGAGMLGMPLITYNAGFFPSLALFILSFLFMTATALLLAETSFHFNEKASLLDMSGELLGKEAKWLTCILFLFLMYALLVAYTIGAADILVDLTSALHLPLPHSIAMFIVTFFFGLILYKGTRFMDGVNRILMVGLALGYLALISMGAPKIDTQFLAHYQWKDALFIAPIMVISFGYHNLIPSMRKYLPDAKSLKKTLFYGAVIPLAVYLIWEFVLLGLLPTPASAEINQMISSGTMISDILAKQTSNPFIVLAAILFTFSAITTSYIGQSLSIIDLLGSHFKSHRLTLTLMTLAPPYLIAVYYPDLFLKALSAAGAYGALVVFGLIPIMMAHKARLLHPHKKPLLRGGRPVLALLALFALAIIFLEIVH